MLHLPEPAISTIEQYLKLVDCAHLQMEKVPTVENQDRTLFPEFSQWMTKHGASSTPSTRTEKLVRDLMYEPSLTTLQEELEKIRDNLSRDTPLSWLVEILREELWELKPPFKTVWDQ